MKAPVNITNAELLEASGIQPGDPVHAGVVGTGQYTNDALFARRMMQGNQVTGVILKFQGEVHELPWSDLTELWALPLTYALSEPQKGFRKSEFDRKLYGVS